MKILSQLMVGLNYAGLSFQERHSKSKCYLIVLLFWVSSMSMLVIGLTMYLKENFDNIAKVFKELVFEFGFAVYCIKAIIYLTNRQSYLILVNKLQDNIDKKLNDSSISIYLRAEKQCTLVIRLFYGTIAITCISVTIEPLVYVAYKYFAGTLTINDWKNPVPLELLGSSTKTPGFEISYIVNVCAFTGLVLVVSGLDSLFLGLGIHISAGLKDLQNMILKMDEYVDGGKEDRTTLTVDDKKNIFIYHMKKCIEFHNYLIDCRTIFQDVKSGIIFISMIETILLLCTILFQLTKMLKLRMGDILFNINAFSSMQFILFIYSYIGNLLTTEGVKVAASAYASQWYMRTPVERKYYLQLLSVAQKPRYLTGLHFFNCSMETFAWVLKASFSTLALMRTVEEN